MEADKKAWPWIVAVAASAPFLLGACTGRTQTGTDEPARARVVSAVPAVTEGGVAHAQGLGSDTGAARVDPWSAPGADEAVGSGPPRWPLRIELDGRVLTIYTPQLERFEEGRIAARAAVSITALDAGSGGDDGPTFGAIWIEGNVDTDRVARTVTVVDAEVARARFPESGGASEDVLSAAIRAALADEPLVLSLDQIVAQLAATREREASDVGLRADPPRIVFRYHPAVKLQYDGPPRSSQVEGSDLLRVVNTPFFVALDPATRRWYLKGAGAWFTADDPLGPFEWVEAAPAVVRELAERAGYVDPETARAGLVAQAIEIVVATAPAELVVVDGPPEFATIAGTDLLYVANTEADLFLSIDDQRLYLVLAGRWYSASSLEESWAFVEPDALPPGFARIPLASAKGDVLAHVAGTEAAAEAMLEAEVPVTASVDREAAAPPPVEYDGEPELAPVEASSDVAYVVNSTVPVLRWSTGWYSCYGAVWYESVSAHGPWRVCSAVPVALYAIPPACPVYPVRFVRVYDVGERHVRFGYTQGYVGSYPWHGVVVWGTGWHYSPWVGSWYQPRPWTFGFHAHYDAYAGFWGSGVGFGPSVGWFPYGSGAWSTWWVHGAWFGHGGFQPHYGVHSVADMADVGSSPPGRIVSNVYERRPDVGRAVIAQRTARTRTEDLGRESNAAEAFRIESAREADRIRRARETAVRPRDGAVAPVEATSPARERVRSAERRDAADDVFTDREGDVYRRGLDGWEVRTPEGRWTRAPGRAPIDAPAGDAAARDAARGETPAVRELPPAVREAPALRDDGSQRAPPSGPAPRATRPNEELDRDLRARSSGATRYERMRPQPSVRTRPATPPRTQRPAPTPARPQPAPPPVRPQRP